MNAQINEYIENATATQQEIMKNLRSIILETIPDAKEQYKWNRPVFCLEGDFAYLKVTNKHVNLGFFNFEKIKDVDHRLEGTGKEMRHIKFKSVEEIDEDMLKEWLLAVTFKQKQ